jgi:hypothetical protein
VIGGLLFATVATLTLVPAVFCIFHHKRGSSRRRSLLADATAESARELESFNG